MIDCDLRERRRLPTRSRSVTRCSIWSSGAPSPRHFLSNRSCRAPPRFGRRQTHASFSTHSRRLARKRRGRRGRRFCQKPSASSRKLVQHGGWTFMGGHDPVCLQRRIRSRSARCPLPLSGVEAVTWMYAPRSRNPTPAARVDQPLDALIVQAELGCHVANSRRRRVGPDRSTAASSRAGVAGRSSRESRCSTLSPSNRMVTVMFLVPVRGERSRTGDSFVIEVVAGPARARGSL